MFHFFFVLFFCSFSSLLAEGDVSREEWLRRAEPILKMKEPNFLLISVKAQKMAFFQHARLVSVYTISSAKNGTGQREGSFQTPLGLHRISDKIGKGAAPNTIFSSRKNTGKIWQNSIDNQEKDLILSRILWLDGLEEGYNRGKDPQGFVVDSRKRMIYIHGTNQEKLIGKPASRGCIRMKMKELIEIFDRVPTGTLVSIQN